MFGWAIDKMTIWKSVQQVGAGMEFVLDENEEPRCEADGTGVGITGIAKRGKELKVLVQYKKGGGTRVAALISATTTVPGNIGLKKALRSSRNSRRLFCF